MIIRAVALTDVVENLAAILEEGRQEGIQVPQRLRVVRPVRAAGIHKVRTAALTQERF